MANPDLEYIKKKYSEVLAHLCRELFPTLLEFPGVLPMILENNFAYSKNLGQDIIDKNAKTAFQEFILSKSPLKQERVESDKSVFELMYDAGYIISPECETEDDIQSFRHYYISDNPGEPYIDKYGQILSRSGEELCTFNGGRLDYCRVWFAVKLNADDLKRENFISPRREDEYGTSVISIQFSRGDTQTVSIKNRYNHTVNNPDATFSNNLDNIIPGLTSAFEKEYNLNILTCEKDLKIEGYVKANDGKRYRYNMLDIRDNAFCENNTIITNWGEVIHTEQNAFLVDTFVIDVQNKKIYQHDLHRRYYHDSFPEIFGEIIKIDVVKNGKNKDFVIYSKDFSEPSVISVNQNNQIIGVKNNNCTNINSNFLLDSKNVSYIELNKLECCESGFLQNNSTIKEISLPSLKQCGVWFMGNSRNLEKASFPNLTDCGDGFLINSSKLNSINVENLIKCGNSFLENNYDLNSIDAPNLVSCGYNFLRQNKKIETVNLPLLNVCESGFMSKNEELTSLNLPNLVICNDHFLSENKKIGEINLPSLGLCGDDFLKNVENIESFTAPSLTKCGSNFLMNASKITDINLPELRFCKSNFLANVIELETACFNKLKKCDNGFLYYNKRLSHLEMNSLHTCGDEFLSSNIDLKEINLPELTECGNYFLSDNNSIEKFNLPKLLNYGRHIFQYNDFVDSVMNGKFKRTSDGISAEGKTIKPEDIQMPMMINKIAQVENYYKNQQNDCNLEI